MYCKMIEENAMDALIYIASDIASDDIRMVPEGWKFSA